jgi:tetratricopeptide (TPR) repeat protein
MTKSLLMLLVCAVMGQAVSIKAPIEILDETYVLAAMDAQVRQKYDVASHYFKHLYEKTGNKEFLYDSLRMYESLSDTAVFANAAQEALSHSPKDKTLLRFNLIALLKAGKYSEASLEALKLSRETKESTDYLLGAEALIKLGQYENGYSELKKAYEISFDNETAERMALLMYTQLGKKEEAIRFLQEHISAHGNSKVVGKRLGSLYADSGALDDAAQVYEATYDLSTDPMIAQEAARIYIYQQNFLKLKVILEKSGVNDPLLLELYARDKEFKKASKLARTLYKREANPLYLAQSSVFEYEAASDHNDSKLLKEVIEGLTQANNEIDDPVYLNYLGYLMIDHDLNIHEGMEYVKKALVKQPDSAFYLDSLAWGNYKLGECAEAMRLMKQVESMIGTDEQEVKDHLKAIQQCKTKETK